MSFKVGYEGKVYRNTGSWALPTWVEVTIVQNVTTPIEKSSAKFADRASPWRKSKGVIKDSSIDMQVSEKETDAGFIALRDAFLNDTLIELAIMNGDITVSNNQGLRAEFEVLKFERAEPLEEGMPYKLSLAPGVGSNEPVWHVIP